MPPFDRRSKTPTASRPPYGFDAPANNNSAARMPWEREDDDEFGPPAALDVTPGEAESEAKRMIYEKTHPMHEALMQNAHLDHNRAMRRYAALARRAWDPAARDLPVKTGKQESSDTSDGTHASPLQRAVELQPGITHDARPTPLQGPVASHVSRDRDRDTKPTPLRHKEPTLPQTQTPANRLSGEDLNFLPADVLAHRAEGARQAQQRVLATQRGAESATLPPYAIPYSTFLGAKEEVEARDDLSDGAKYLLLGLIGYENLTHDTGGGSSGGITSETFTRYKNIVSELRRLRGDAVITAASVSELTANELFDFQYAYLVVELHPTIGYPDGITLNDQVKLAAFATKLAESNVLDRIGSGAIAFQIADCVFNYSSLTGVEILQKAFNHAIAQMPADYREAYGYETLAVDGVLGTLTFTGITALARNPRYKDLFLDWIRVERTLSNIEKGTYTGNNRWRIWGVSKPHAGG
jgi:lysozyme family protein